MLAKMMKNNRAVWGVALMVTCSGVMSASAYLVRNDTKGINYSGSTCLQDAISAASDGDNIWINPEYERTESISIGKTLSIGVDPDEPDYVGMKAVINGDVSMMGSMRGYCNATLFSLEINGSVSATYSNGSIKKSTINGANSSGNIGVYIGDSGNFLVENCKVKNFNTGIWVESCGATIRGCLISECVWNGVKCSGDFDYYYEHVDIVNCTIVNNQYFGIRNEYSIPIITAANNILWGNGYDLDGSGVTSLYSCIQDPDSGTGVIHTNPNLDSSFRPQSSACINSGSLSYYDSGFAEDIEGDTRVKGSSIDMGCYEY